MRGLLYLCSALTVIGLAVWAYHENYRTQQAIAEAEAVSREIGRIHEELAMLRAEWAYLNRPDRLRALAALNFDTLGLLPLRPEQFGRVDQIGFPPAEAAQAPAAPPATPPANPPAPYLLAPAPQPGPALAPGAGLIEARLRPGDGALGGEGTPPGGARQ